MPLLLQLSGPRPLVHRVQSLGPAMTSEHKCDKKQGNAKHHSCSWEVQGKAEKGGDGKDYHGEDEQACHDQVDQDPKQFIYEAFNYPFHYLLNLLVNTVYRKGTAPLTREDRNV